MAIAKAPYELKVIAAAESNSIAKALISTLVDASLPIVIVLAVADGRYFSAHEAGDEAADEQKFIGEA